MVAAKQEKHSSETKSFDIKNSPKRRQRLGPSCDSCRVRKVKCNADIVIVLKDMAAAAETSTLYNKVDFAPLLKQEVTSVPLDSEYQLISSHNKLIKFKPCTNCTARTIDCCFSKGFTKEDMLHKKPSDNLSVSKALDSSAKTHHQLASKKRKLSAVEACEKPASPTSVASLCGASYETKDVTTSSTATAAQSKSTALPVPALIPIPAFDGSRRSSCAGCRKRKVKCVYDELSNKCHGCLKKGHECLFT